MNPLSSVTSISTDVYSKIRGQLSTQSKIGGTQYGNDSEATKAPPIDQITEGSGEHSVGEPEEPPEESVRSYRRNSVPLYKRVQEQFESEQESAFEERKRKLAELREFKTSIPLAEIKEHASGYKKEMKQK